ncbi:ABC transporter ATP-binding protein [Clostridia bacterium]|nr:ABC transporter ATP-binding protein [Clostridia bacterium]
MNILKTSKLLKTFKQGTNFIYAVNDVDFIVQKGQFISIIGTSGSGKSTLLHLCAGIDRVSGGNIFIDDVDITKLDSDKLADIRRNKIGLIFQQFYLLPMMTVKENIVVPNLLNNHKPDKFHFETIVETLGIADRLDHFPSELSGGQIQRVAIARALINKPSIILADEPTGNLDKQTSEEIISFFKLLNRQGNTIIMVTHDMNIAEQTDVIYKMSDGKINKI